MIKTGYFIERNTFTDIQITHCPCCGNELDKNNSHRELVKKDIKDHSLFGCYVHTYSFYRTTCAECGSSFVDWEEKGSVDKDALSSIILNILTIIGITCLILWDIENPSIFTEKETSLKVVVNALLTVALGVCLITSIVADLELLHPKLFKTKPEKLFGKED